MRERIFQKEPQREYLLVCYGSRYTPASTRTEIEARGKTTVIESINAVLRARAMRLRLLRLSLHHCMRYTDILKSTNLVQPLVFLREFYRSE